MRSTAPLKYWVFRLTFNLIVAFIGGGVTSLVAVYFLVPFTLWLTTPVPFELPDSVLLHKTWNFIVCCTFWGGGIIWLSEFLPWLIRVIRSRRDNG